MTENECLCLSIVALFLCSPKLHQAIYVPVLFIELTCIFAELEICFLNFVEIFNKTHELKGDLKTGTFGLFSQFVKVVQRKFEREKKIISLTGPLTHLNIGSLPLPIHTLSSASGSLH